MPFIQCLFKYGGKALTAFRPANERIEYLLMPFAKFAQKRCRLLAFSGSGLSRGFDEAIRDSTHRRNDHDDSICARGIMHNFGNSGDARGIANRSSAELHHAEGSAHFSQLPSESN